jgi:hypothetical protein
MSRNGTLLSLVLVVVLVGLASLVATGAIGRRPPSPRPTTRPTLDLSGDWGGQSTGPFNGSLSLTLTQTANALHGTIMVETSTENLQISGDVSGTTVDFGAPGVVMFTGTLSGSTISGSYTVIANGRAGAGSWTATLTP